MDTRPIIHIIGILLSALAVSMIIPMATDLYYGHQDWKVFFLCIVITSFFGGLMILTTSGKAFHITAKQGFLLITLSWVVLSLFAALPFWLSHLGISFTDSIFEAVSGITTTGSTVFTNLESMPKGILIWRALLQWLGGIGIIIMAMSILPFLKVGGMQLFKTELSEHEKLTPRATDFATAIGIVYLALTLLCALSYSFTGLNGFDSIAHAMTTIATGGFGTYDTSFFAFENSSTLTVAIIFMISGGIPFILYLKAVNGNISSIFSDVQVKWFIAIIVGVSASIFLYNINSGIALHIGQSNGEIFQHALFNTVSVLTGTGYASSDYNAWGVFPLCMLFFLTAVGACAGSTSCGIKIFRFQILYVVTKVQIKKLLYPNAVFIPHYAGKPMPEGVPISVMSFFFLFALSFAVLTIALSLTDLDFITATSGALTAIANVGPAFGDTIGPAGNFQPLSDTAKWILTVGMLLGRLEIFTILVLFTPFFWKR